jgi:small-conductance mechanosensitive channel
MRGTLNLISRLQMSRKRRWLAMRRAVIWVGAAASLSLLSPSVAPAIAQDIALTAAPDSAPDTTGGGAIPLDSPDAAIQQRIGSLFEQVGDLQGVRVRVLAGVVTLEGTALDEEANAKAADLASRIEGVVSVENHIDVEHRVDRRLQPLIAKSEQIVRDTIAFMPLVLIALLAFVAFWFLGRIFTRSTRVFKRLAPNPFIETLLEQVVRLFFVIAGLVVAMSVLGWTALIGSVLGAAGVLGLAIGFAVRDTIENYIASILLSVRRPFAPNDVVVIEGFEGKVARLNSRATILILADGTQVRLPNATVYKANITNLSHNRERRFEFDVGIGFENDINCALATALNTIKQVDGVLDSPKAQALVDRIEEHAVVIKALGWVDQSKSDFGKAKSEAIRMTKEAFDAENISIPEPIRNLRTLPEMPIVDRSGQALKASPEDRAAIRDTGFDETLDVKVEEARQGPEEDLLTHAAPRE